MTNKMTGFFQLNKFLLTLLLILTSHLGNATSLTVEKGANNKAPVSKTTLDPSRKIPIDPTRWYILNNTTSSLAGLFDGETQKTVELGYGLVLSTYDAYYPLREGESMTLDHIRMFDFEGTFTNNPARLSIITSDWKRVPVATFTGSVYNDWVGPDPNRQATGDAKFSLDTPVKGIRYLVLTTQGGLPTELELYGDYQPGNPPSVNPSARPVQLRDMLGVNAYEWNFLEPNLSTEVNEPKMQLAKSFSGIRHYMDWQKLESAEGVFSYNPTLSGGWHYDEIYERCKAEGIEVLACLKTLPDWMLATYPAAERDHENVPVRYGRAFDDPASYREQARVAFQYTARYGSNKGVDPKLLSVYDKPRWPGDQPNTVRIGTDLIKYIECDNERDKWWKGRKGYQTAREYAANMSAFYDGHKNTMGPGIGVKNADPNMKVVIGGLVGGAEYIRGMVDWCKEFRGYKPNGQVNLCWDVINYHVYTDDASSSQSGTSTRGAAPEKTSAGAKADAFILVSNELCNGMPVWITETGFDVSQQSPIKAIPIGQKSALTTQADWILRTSLFSARHGIQRVFFYQMYDDNELSGSMFATSGLLNSNGTRRPSADYLRQTKDLFGEYYYGRTLNQDPVVDEYTDGGKRMYALVVPDEVGRTTTYNLSVGTAREARVYRPAAGRDSMIWTNEKITDGQVRVEVGETPLFVVLDPTDNPSSVITGLPPMETSLNVIVYPNPVTNGQFQVKVDNDGSGDILINLFSASTGTLFRQLTLSGGEKQIIHDMDLSKLAAGEYIIEVIQNEKHAFKKVVNIN